MDDPTLIKRKAKLTSQKEISESSIPQLEWMIRWMQEMDLVLQEFVQLNNMRKPNYSPNMMGLMHFHHEVKKQESEEKEDSEDEEGEK
ncbi:hypothetical protein J1N35_033927 [Gossypium stocksii]|uniref:Uncharacterized protein n=1 Tax=Gossypium stocksii TaxID=47602 RepID=A0A9D3UR40_9ROSI|nr:hypothetical protein J1N35_033927 [Gossypium stocksii]